MIFCQRRFTCTLALVFVCVAFQALGFSKGRAPRPRIPVLQYHDQWVCLNKPAGLTVHRSAGTPRNKPVLTTTVKRQLARKVFPVHRLDHRTSGAILMAFDSETAGRIHEAAIRKGSKQYIALVRGVWNFSEETHLVDKALKVNEVMKNATTKFTVLATTPDDSPERASLLLCEPLTGRTHQIRRHAYAMGYPIIGDSEHGDSRVNRWWREERGLNRLALHCWMIEFQFDGDQHTCFAPLSEELSTPLKKTSLWEAALECRPSLSSSPFDERGGTFGRNYRPKEATGEIEK